MITDRSEVTNMIRAEGCEEDKLGGDCKGDWAEQGMDDGRLPWPDGVHQGTSGKDRCYLRTFRRGGRLAPDRALQRVPANRSADRPSDLPLVRDCQHLRNHDQAIDPRGIWRRHHERDRFLDGY
jgi:hypothetical protein